MTATESPVSNPFDILSSDVLENPYPLYRMLREGDPVHWEPTLKGWIVTRHDDVYGALRDPGRFSSDRIDELVTSRVPREARPLVAPFTELAAQWLWMQDPPEHTRLRSLMNHGFTPRSVSGLRPKVQDIVDRLLDEASGSDRMDLITDFAYPLPAYILADIYGLPREDAGLLKYWSDQMKVFIGGSPDLAGTAGPAVKALDDMMRYFAAAVAERRTSPREDLITRLVQAQEEGKFLAEEELCSNLVLVLGASYVTTMDMIGNGVLALLRQREQWELLREQPDLMRHAVDEILRYDGPVQLTHRLATTDMQLRFREIAKGDIVYLIRGAANRDPDRFTDPDRLDITRTDTGHVAFGAGIHYCIGAALARIEGEAALRTLIERYPHLDLDPDHPPKWRGDSLQFRGLATLPVVLDGQRRR